MVEVVPSDDSGELDLAALEGMLAKGGVKAVAITHVPTNGGVINPAREGEYKLSDPSFLHGCTIFAHTKDILGALLNRAL